MATRPISQVALVDVHARITRAMYDSVLSECKHCTCGITSFIRQAIAHELASRVRTRKEAADDYILEIAAALEGEPHA
jgi:hypothetical protein